MDASQLHVIAVVNNPARFESRLKLYNAFQDHMLESGVTLHTIECAYGEIPFAADAAADHPDVDHIKVRATSHVWIKENLINLAIQRLPPDAKYIAWIDADIHFRKPGWAEETLYALQHFPIVQPWEKCFDLGPNDELMDTHNSFCRQFSLREPMGNGKGSPYTFAHPGYAWAATRQALEHTGGLIEHGILGAGDHHMALALIGKARDSFPGGITQRYKDRVLAWEDRARTHIGKKIGFIPFNIEHHFHGSKSDRKYVDRWQVLVKHDFNPDIDIRRNTYGVLELTGNKPELQHDMWRYFRARNEDANCI